MRMTMIALSLLVAATLFGCGDPAGTDPPPAPPPPSSGLTLQTVGTFNFPLLAVSPPGDLNRLFVVEKRGTIRVVEQGSIVATPFLDLSGQVSTGQEQGLLGLAFHPQYQSNGLLVVNYTNQAGDTRVSLFRVSATDPNRADPTSEQVILAVDQPFANHNGGMVAFSPTDGHLFIGLGDGGSGGDPQGNGQKMSTLLGKLLRLAVSASGQVTVPGDNPFVGQGTARPEIWSLGLRNPWRFSFDRQTGDLYIGDVGQGSREEIDALSLAASKGANFGWNTMEGRSCYNAGSCNQQGLTLPVLDYSHSGGACSVTGGYLYRGAAIASLRGTYFYADYCAGWVRSFRLENGAVTDAKDWTELAPGGRITSFGEDARGELYLMTDGGRVARIVASP
jgi:glucose/arabinose dehydrogenase